MGLKFFFGIYIYFESKSNAKGCSFGPPLMSPSVLETNLNMGDNDVFLLVRALIIQLLFATIILALITALTAFFVSR